MGAVHFSLDVRLVEYLRRALPLSIFVETGTFEGASVEVCLRYFERIHTVELSKAYYSAAVEKFKNSPQVDVRCGTSAAFLRELAAALRNESVFYWLDAHWCVAEEVEGGTSQCPLLDELNALRHLNGQSVVCIDDARLFLCPPPRPHQIDDWPRFDEIVRRLRGLSADHELLVVNDVILFFPASARTSIHTYARQHGVDWLTVLGKARDYDHHLPIIRKEAERRAAGLDELTAVIAARDRRISDLEQTRDGRIRDLEQTVRERLDALQRADTSLREAWTAAEQRAAGLEELTRVIAARDGRISDLEETARERLEALQRADRLLREAAAEAERQAAAVRELTAMIAARDGRISGLEQTEREMSDALQREKTLLREARTKAGRLEAELEALTATVVARDQRIAQLSEKMIALTTQADVLKQTLLLLKEESLATFLARRAKALWPR